MANELRKTLGRNMRYANINEQIDNQIKQLQSQASYDLGVQSKINALQQQREANLQHMRQPMSAEEYTQYDDNGQYLGNQSSQPKQTNGIGQTITDGITHAAQGTSLGWSDELNGAIGGTGRVVANGLMRATGNNVNGESFGDAWNKGYTEYRDFARQELQEGYQRNPGISAGSEIVGSAISPVKIHKASGYTGSLGNWISSAEDIAKSRFINSVGTGVINGAGYTNENNPWEYSKNIVNSTITNVGGTILGNKTFGSGNNMYKVGRGTTNTMIQSIPYGYSHFRKKNEDDEY